MQREQGHWFRRRREAVERRLDESQVGDDFGGRRGHVIGSNSFVEKGGQCVFPSRYSDTVTITCKDGYCIVCSVT